MKLNLDVSNVFEKNWEAYQKGIRNIVNQGGSRSTKTYSIAQLYLTVLYTAQNTILSVCRKTLPALRVSVLRDFLDIMKAAGVYRDERFNKTELIYSYGSNLIEFFSIDESAKVRGRKRNLLWLNEANEFSREDYRQLGLRTIGQIFYDYNPSDEFHWIYDDILTRNDCTLIKSTYLDNPYLEKSIVKEIERYKEIDKNYWTIYGLGERGVGELKIYTHWQYCDKLPDNPDEIIYGLDFGYNHPTALVKIALKDDNMYWQQEIYETHLTTTDIIDRLKTLGLSKNVYIYADSEAPDAIKEIRNAGYNIKPAKKEKGSVVAGIKFMKTKKFYITKDSPGLLKEAKSYSWKEKDGKPLDEPVKQNDHGMDAGRYAIYTHIAGLKAGLFV